MHLTTILCFLLGTALLCCGRVIARKSPNADKWEGCVLYQLFTDRFARSDGKEEKCWDTSTYCGGDFNGATQRLGYLSDLGVDAVWISPVIDQFKNGYHVSHAHNQVLS